MNVDVIYWVKIQIPQRKNIKIILKASKEINMEIKYINVLYIPYS
jgi:hypothetical protein